jgi:hypothetical protein
MSDTAYIIVNVKRKTIEADIKDIKAKNIFNLYPVPAKDKLYIVIPEELGEVEKIDIANINGQVVQAFSKNNITRESGIVCLSLNSSGTPLQNGLYILYVVTTKQQISRKLIVQ